MGAILVVLFAILIFVQFLEIVKLHSELGKLEDRVDMLEAEPVASDNVVDFMNRHSR